MNKTYFTDTDGNPSSKRLGAFIVLITALLIVIFGMIKDKDILDLIMLWGAMTGTALALWGMSKAGENKARQIEKGGA